MACGLWVQFWLVVITLITASTIMAVAPIDRNGLVNCITKWWGRTLLSLTRVSVEVQGLEHLIPGQPYVFAANHSSDFDIFALSAILPGRVLFLAKESLFRIPLLGPALLRIGSVPLGRCNLKQAKKNLDRAAARVKTGTSMIIFLGGTPVPTPGLVSFKKGVFLMALKASQPTVLCEHQRYLLHYARGVPPGPPWPSARDHLASYQPQGLAAQGGPDERSLPCHCRQLRLLLSL